MTGPRTTADYRAVLARQLDGDDRELVGPLAALFALRHTDPALYESLVAEILAD